MRSPTSAPLPHQRSRDLWIAAFLWVIVGGLFLMVAQALAVEAQIVA